MRAPFDRCPLAGRYQHVTDAELRAWRKTQVHLSEQSLVARRALKHALDRIEMLEDQLEAAETVRVKFAETLSRAAEDRNEIIKALQGKYDDTGDLAQDVRNAVETAETTVRNATELAMVAARMREALMTIAHDHHRHATEVMGKTWQEALGWAQDIARGALLDITALEDEHGKAEAEEADSEEAQA